MLGLGLEKRFALGRWAVSSLVCLGLAAAAWADTARYEVTFDATWSAQTHPYDFPSNPHFSGLIGGTHQASVTFWKPGGIASQGIENMAELGSKSPLDAEVQAAINAGQADSVISGGGIAKSPGRVATQFEIRDDFPLVTLVSMIAPSPDWFVGVAGLNLRQGDEWVGKVVVDLDPYDAGSDHGVSFASPDADTNPQVPIAHITGFPFQDTPPLGTFTFLRLLPGDFNRSGTCCGLRVRTFGLPTRLTAANNPRQTLTWETGEDAIRTFHERHGVSGSSGCRQAQLWFAQRPGRQRFHELGLRSPAGAGRRDDASAGASSVDSRPCVPACALPHALWRRQRGFSAPRQPSIENRMNAERFPAALGPIVRPAPWPNEVRQTTDSPSTRSVSEVWCLSPGVPLPCQRCPTSRLPRRLAPGGCPNSILGFRLP